MADYSINAKTGQLKAIQEGHWMGSSPYGYMDRYNEITGQRYLKPDPETAPIVKAIFELYATNSYSIVDINDLLIKQYNLSKDGLSRANIYKILVNPFYYGIMLFKNKLYPHNYETIITKELFIKCEEILMNNNSHKKKTSNKHKHIYQTLIKCAECGCSISPCYSWKGKCTYYYCTQGRYEHPFARLREEHITIQIKNILSPEIANYFDTLTFGEKKIFLQYFFKLILLDMNQIVVEESDKSKDIGDIKNFIEKRINLIKKSNISDDKLIDDKTFDNIFLNHCKKPKTLDELISLTGLPLDDIQNQLMDLMLDGKIEEENGKWRTNA